MHHSRMLIATILLASAPVTADTFYVGSRIGISMIDDTVNTSSGAAGIFPALPSEISLQGRPFNSNETTAGAFVGWQAKEWLAIELAYSDLGNTGQGNLLGIIGVPFLVTPVTPTVIPPAGIGGFTGAVQPASLAAALNIEEWSLSAKFSKSLVSELSAHWSVGVTRAQFDAQGDFTFPQTISVNPPVFSSVDIPYASPASETGFVLGFGFSWDFSDRYSTDVVYERHDTQVIDIETVTLRVIAAF